MIQKEPPSTNGDPTQATIIMLTHSVVEGRMNEAIQNIEQLDSISGPVVRIRMEQLSK
jgi:homoserine dehydrogenase